MISQPNHEMQLEIVHPSGAEEWYCSTCGRRILMQWPPEYNKVIIKRGDEFVYHNGSKGGLHISLSSIENA